MRVQVFGQSGMLGSAVVKAIRGRGHELSPHQADLELVSASHIHGDVVINCAGLVKQRQYPASRFMVVNAVGPHRLAEACDQAGARLIHVSTDCVFSRSGPHCECDAPDASDPYARSKLAGEVAAPHLTIRTSFVGFGTRGLIAAMLSGGQMSASDNLLWSGHTVDTVADVLITLAERSDICGLLHFPGEFQTRWELCQALRQRFDLPALLMHDNSFRADRRLSSDLWAKLGLRELPGFAAQLETMERP